jgi:hypothetical protein
MGLYWVMSKARVSYFWMIFSFTPLKWAYFGWVYNTCLQGDIRWSGACSIAATLGLTKYRHKSF